MQAGQPGYETALEPLHIQTGKQHPQLIMAQLIMAQLIMAQLIMAQLIMAWRSVPERQKAAAAQEFQLLFSMERD